MTPTTTTRRTRCRSRSCAPWSRNRSTVGPPQPYQFTYQAGRYPNHVDRTHRSVQSDAPALGTAVVRSPGQ